MPTNSAPFLPFWSSLFLRPRTFFRTYLAEAADRPPYFLLAILLYGVGHGIERADKQLTKADLKGNLERVDWLNNWPTYWMVAIFAGLLGGYLAYLVAGWFYHLRLRWAGASPDMARARSLYLYSSVVASVAYVANALLATALLAQPYPGGDELTTSEGFGGLVMMLFLFYSVYVSYCGVTTITDAQPEKARWWFLILPILVYSLALGVLVWAFAIQA